MGRWTIEWARVLAGVLVALAVAAVVGVLVVLDAEGVSEESGARAPLPGCGEVRWLDVHAGAGGAAADCFGTALREGLGAESVIRGSTAEGDPVSDQYRALSGGGIERWGDARADGYAATGWWYARCPGARGLLHVGACADRGF